jgi:hypothetical protein
VPPPETLALRLIGELYPVYGKHGGGISGGVNIIVGGWVVQPRKAGFSGGRDRVCTKQSDSIPGKSGGGEVFDSKSVQKAGFGAIPGGLGGGNGLPGRVLRNYFAKQPVKKSKQKRFLGEKKIKRGTKNWGGRQTGLYRVWRKPWIRHRCSDIAEVGRGCSKSSKKKCAACPWRLAGSS